MTDTLISRLEQAEAGSRELDCRVWASLPGQVPFDVAVAVVPDLGQWQAPAYTTSIDAAMTLVPEGDYDLDWLRSTRGKSEGFKLWQIRIALETVEQDHDETGPVALGEHDHPALALCIAALKAKP